MVTRRVFRRQLLLVPSKKINQVLGYLLGVCARRHGIRVHAFCVLSNHYHLVATDTRGVLPDFLRDYHALVARHLNAILGRFEGLWATRQTSVVRLEEPTDIINEIAYTASNPVEAGLVRYGKSWPGLRMVWGMRVRRFRRPIGFLRKGSDGGTFPPEVMCELTRPPGFEDLSDTLLLQEISANIEHEEEVAREKILSDGRSFLGARAVRQQRRTSYPRSREPRFGLSPRIAAGDRRKRIAAIQRDRAWRDEYRRCRSCWLSGDRTVEFPHGTFKMRRECGVRCRPPP